MLSGIMFIAYIAIFILQIVLLVLSVRKKSAKLWLFLILSEVIPMIAAFILMRYFNNLPGYGFMPGLSYFGEVISSLGAVILYAVTLFISLCTFLVVKVLQKRKLHRDCDCNTSVCEPEK